MHLISLFFPATPNVDYTSIPGRFDTGRLRLSSSRTRQCLTIRSSRSDTTVENTEEFFVGLQSTGPLPPFVELARTSAVVFILDNDSKIHPLSL